LIKPDKRKGKSQKSTEKTIRLKICPAAKETRPVKRAFRDKNNELPILRNPKIIIKITLPIR
jgi:hypothetical protein